MTEESAKLIRQRVLPAVGLLALAAVAGALAASAPEVVLVGLAVVVVVLGVVVVPLLRLPIASLALGGVVAWHFVSLLRNTWLDDIFPLFRFLRLALGLVLLVLLLPQFGAFLGRRGRAVLLVPLLFASWVTVSAVWSKSPVQSAFYGSWLMLLVTIVVLVVLVVDDPKKVWTTWLTGLAWGGTAVCGLSLLLSLLGVEAAQSERFVFGTAAYGIRGLFFSPNQFGAVACLTLASALGLRLLRGEDGWTPGLVLLALVMTGISLATLSRSASLSIVLVFASYFVLSGGWRGRLSHRSVWLAILIVGGVAVVQSEYGSNTLGRFTETREHLAGGEEPRIHIWRSYLRGFGRKPFAGTGYRNKEVGSEYMTRRVTGGTLVEPHNALIDYGLTTGVPGLFLFVATLLLGAVGLVRAPPMLRKAVLQVVIVMSPQYLAQAMTSPGAWGPFVMWVPLILMVSLSGATATAPLRAGTLPGPPLPVSDGQGSKRTFSSSPT